MEIEIKEKHTDFVDTISMVLRDLTFNQNQSVKSANDSNGICYTGLLTACEQAPIYQCRVYSEELMMDRGTVRNM